FLFHLAQQHSTTTATTTTRSLCSMPTAIELSQQANILSSPPLSECVVVPLSATRSSNNNAAGQQSPAPEQECLVLVGSEHHQVHSSTTNLNVQQKQLSVGVVTAIATQPVVVESVPLTTSQVFSYCVIGGRHESV